MPSHNEPCPRCPPFVVRCGHLGEELVLLMYWNSDGHFVTEPRALSEVSQHPTRAEADAEFGRREEALLA